MAALIVTVDTPGVGRPLGQAGRMTSRIESYTRGRLGPSEKPGPGPLSGLSEWLSRQLGGAAHGLISWLGGRGGLRWPTRSNMIGGSARASTPCNSGSTVPGLRRPAAPTQSRSTSSPRAGTSTPRPSGLMAPRSPESTGPGLHHPPDRRDAPRRDRDALDRRALRLRLQPGPGPRGRPAEAYPIHLPEGARRSSARKSSGRAW